MGRFSRSNRQKRRNKIEQGEGEHRRDLYALRAARERQRKNYRTTGDFRTTIFGLSSKSDAGVMGNGIVSVNF